MPDSPMVQLQSAAFATPLEFILDEASPQVTGGTAFYQDVARPKRRTAIEWQGMTAYRLTIAGILDDFANAGSVEAKIKKLEVMATARHGVLEPPPPVTITGGNVPHKDLTYVIETLDWGDSVWEGGTRTRQRFTITLCQKVDLESTVREQARTPATGKKTYRIVTLQAGINLRELAAVSLGNSARWGEILSMKGTRFRDYNQKAGTRVKVPRQ